MLSCLLQSIRHKMTAFKFVLSLFALVFTIFSVADAQHCSYLDACDLTHEIRGIHYGTLTDSCKNVFKVGPDCALSYMGRLN